MSDDEDLTYSSIKTVLGGARRDERWHLTDEVDVLTILGSGRFDLRDVETSGRDVVEINVTCVLGVVDLVVPVGTMVVLDGTSFLASAKSRVAGGCSSELPRLEVTATTVLGRVRVRTKDAADEPCAADAAAEAAEADTVDVGADHLADAAAEAPEPAPAAPAPVEPAEVAVAEADDVASLAP